MLRLSDRLQRAGLDEGSAAATCLDFDLAVAHFGRWADHRERDTREVPLTGADKRKKQTKQVPKFPTLAHILGIAPESASNPATPAPRPRRTETTDTPLDREVDRLRRDPAALVDFLRLNGQ